MLATHVETPPGARPRPPRPGAADPLIGRRVRERRLMLGVTARELAAALGVPHQQLHKYETGANRLSAGQLYLLAEALGVGVAYLFGEDGADGPAAPTAHRRMLLLLVRDFARIPDRRQQEALARLARTLAGLGAGGDEEAAAER